MGLMSNLPIEPRGFGGLSICLCQKKNTKAITNFITKCLQTDVECD